MPNEIYHRSEWGNPKPLGWGNIYFDADATNELYKRSDNYENSNGTDEILRDISNKASIVLTPTAYDNGSINTVIPPYQVLPEELVTNGDFSNGTTDWENTRGSTITALNNVLTVSSGDTLFAAAARQVITTEIGKKYKWEFTINEANNTRVGIRNGTSNFGSGTAIIDIIDLGVGSYTYTFEAIGTSVSILLGTKNLNNQEKYSNLSVKEIQEADFDFTRASIATRVNEKGLIEEVASGIPRIDYTSGFGSWLLEPFRRNIADYSEDGTEWNTINSTVSLDSSINKPDGIAGAYKVTDNTTNGQHRVDVRATVVNGTQYTFSAFVKQAENSDVDFMYLLFATKFTATRVRFNLSNGTALGSGGTIENYGNGWYRVSATATANADGAGVFGVNLIDSGSGTTYAGTGNGAMYVFGMQVEDAGSGGDAEYVTSYIPTSGSIVTRSAETANNSGNADLFNDSEGVLYAETAALVNDLSVRSISISDSSLDNSIRIAYQTVSNNFNFRIRTNGTSAQSNNREVSDITEFAKVAFKYKSSESSAFINGFKVLTVTSSFAFTNTLNQLRFENGAGSQDFYGNTKELAVFKEALTDAELESLTSWVSFTQMATDLEYTLE